MNNPESQIPAASPMQGLAAWLRMKAFNCSLTNAQETATLRNWANEVEAAASPLEVAAPVVASETHPHSFSCEKTISAGQTCKQWCGNPWRCISTMTYAQPYMQEAYEHGHRDALNAVEAELGAMARSTSPHRRVAAKDLYDNLQKIKPTASSSATPSANATAAELAWRDMEIERLKEIIASSRATGVVVDAGGVTLPELPEPLGCSAAPLTTRQRNVSFSASSQGKCPHKSATFSPLISCTATPA